MCVVTTLSMAAYYPWANKLCVPMASLAMFWCLIWPSKYLEDDMISIVILYFCAICKTDSQINVTDLLVMAPEWYLKEK